MSPGHPKAPWEAGLRDGAEMGSPRLWSRGQEIRDGQGPWSGTVGQDILDD